MISNWIICVEEHSDLTKVVDYGLEGWVSSKFLNLDAFIAFHKSLEEVEILSQMAESLAELNSNRAVF